MKRVALAICAIACMLALAPFVAFAADQATTAGAASAAGTAGAASTTSSVSGSSAQAKAASQAVSVSKGAAVTSTKAASDRTAKAGYYLADGAVYRISSALGAPNQISLDVKDGSSAAGANVQIHARNYTFAQFWRAKYMGKGVYRFVNYAGRYVLAIDGTPKRASNVVVRNSGAFDWKLKKNSDGTFTLVPAKAPKYCLSVAGGSSKNGTNVWINIPNGSKAQKFYFRKSVPLTEAFKAGSSVKSGMVEFGLKDASSLRVDVVGQSTDNNANVRLGTSSASRFCQKWTLRYRGQGLYEIENFLSGKCLDVKNASRKQGANVQQYERNGTMAQAWYIEPLGGGAYRIKSALSGYALYAKKNNAAAGANVQLAKASNVSTQKYTIKRTQVISNGTYVLTPAFALPMALDVKDGSSANGANVQIYRSNGADAQKFKVVHKGGGLYVIANARTGKRVEVAYGSRAHGANVQMNARDDSTLAQKWRVEVGPNGTFRFKSALSGLYLDVQNARVRSGTNVCQASFNGGDAQNWVLHDADWKFYPNSTSFNDLRVLLKAEEYEGWRYAWGGRSPSTSFDCAGLVMYCSNKVWGTNFDLMYTNADRLLNDRYYNHGRVYRISESEARPGDLVFYRGTYGSDINYISHVVFYAGRGWMYGAGDPIGYDRVDAIRNFRGNQATAVYARISH